MLIFEHALNLDFKYRGGYNKQKDYWLERVSQLRSLCLVSKLTRIEAQEAFFGQGKWLLDIDVHAQPQTLRIWEFRRCWTCQSSDWDIFNRFRDVQLWLLNCDDADAVQESMDAVEKRLQGVEFRKLNVHWDANMTGVPLMSARWRQMALQLISLSSKGRENQRHISCGPEIAGKILTIDETVPPTTNVSSLKLLGA